MKAKIFYNCVYCIHKRMKFFVPDLLAALRVIHTNNFFLLWIFFTAGKCTSEFGFLLICNIHDIQKFGREKYGLCQNPIQELFSNMNIYSNKRCNGYFCMQQDNRANIRDWYPCFVFCKTFICVLLKFKSHSVKLLNLLQSRHCELDKRE